MKQHSKLLLYLAPCLLAAPMFAQPAIGGGSCSSATVAGTYALTLSGRGVSLPGLLGTAALDTALAPTVVLTGATLSSVFEAVGTVTFDGQSKATFALTANTALASATSLPWSGTYAMQANCTGTITVTSGGNASLNLLAYNGGASFQLTGGDSTYAYSGSGDTIATGCSTSTLTGAYALTATGYLGVTTGTAGGATAVTAVAQFDGAGNVTVTGSISANGLLAGITTSGPATFTGTYSMGANCVGTATFVNATLGSGSVALSAYTGTSTLTSTLYFGVASAKPDVMFSGNLMWIGPATAQNAGGTPFTSPRTRENSPPRLLAQQTNPGGVR